jgi:hypothetical protein
MARGNVRYSLQAYVAAVVVLFMVAWWRGL